MTKNLATFIVLHQIAGEKLITFQNMPFKCGAESRDDAVRQFETWAALHKDTFEITGVYVDADIKIVCHIEGGVMQGATSNVPVAWMTVDYDCEGGDADTTQVSQGNANGEEEESFEEAYVGLGCTELDVAYTNGRHARYEATGGEEC